MDVNTENCVVRIKIAVLAIVAFAIAGRKTATQQAISSKFAAKTWTNL